MEAVLLVTKRRKVYHLCPDACIIKPVSSEVALWCWIQLDFSILVTFGIFITLFMERQMGLSVMNVTSLWLMNSCPFPRHVASSGCRGNEEDARRASCWAGEQLDHGGTSLAESAAGPVRL